MLEHSLGLLLARLDKNTIWPLRGEGVTDGDNVGNTKVDVCVGNTTGGAVGCATTIGVFEGAAVGFNDDTPVGVAKSMTGEVDGRGEPKVTTPSAASPKIASPPMHRATIPPARNGKTDVLAVGVGKVIGTVTSPAPVHPSVVQ